MAQAKIILGDARQVLDTLPAECVDAVVTSPPYWALRDYEAPDQLGREDTPDEYVAAIVGVMRQARRVLKPQGVLWLNLGDSYANQAGGGPGNGIRSTRSFTPKIKTKRGPGLKRKDLVGIPWRVAFALQADGWWLRSDVVWAKPNPMPESVKDRPTRAHEYVFLLSKRRRYYYDAAAIAEEAVSVRPNGNKARKYGEDYGAPDQLGDRGVAFPWALGEPRNRRDVWTIQPGQFPGAHYAVMPVELAELCVLAGCPPGGVVLDPFAGVATSGVASLRHGRDFIGIELHEPYADMGRGRLRGVAPLFNEVS